MSGKTAVCGHSYSGSEGKCERPEWGNRDYCIWHTDESGKPADALRDAREDDPECLDDCVLTDVAFDDPISFEDCSMQNADLVRADLSGTDLSGADLSDAALFNATLTNARLIRTNLSNAILNSATLHDVSGIYADFEECKGWEADFSGGDLRNANISNVDFVKGTFEGASLHQANLEDSDLRETNMKEAELNWGNLKRADLRQANLSHADLYGAVLDWANLERAFLTNGVLLNASLIGARLSSAVLDGVQIDLDTDFGERSVYDPKFDQEPNPQPLDKSYKEIDNSFEDARRASETYAILEEVAKNNALPDVESRYFILRKDLLRVEHYDARDYGLWIRGWLSNVVVEYGESPWRVVGSTATAIIVCGLLYPIYGIRTQSGIMSYAGESSLLEVLLQSTYFSIVTFTTLGYGDVQPIGFSRTIATVETIAGSALLALLVFVFGRRATR